MHAETDLLGSRTITYSFNEVRYSNITQYFPEIIDYDGDLTPGQWEKKIFRFLYYEYSSGQARMKYADWRVENGQVDDDLKGTAVCQLSDDFLQYLAGELITDSSVSRKPVGIDKMMILNDEELSIFIEISKDQPTGHYIPGFTNFDSGAGILASRYYYTYFAMKLNMATIDSLAYGRFTRHLGFIGTENY